MPYKKVVEFSNVLPFFWIHRGCGWSFFKSPYNWNPQVHPTTSPLFYRVWKPPFFGGVLLELCPKGKLWEVSSPFPWLHGFFVSWTLIFTAFFFRQQEQDKNTINPQNLATSGKVLTKLFASIEAQGKNIGFLHDLCWETIGGCVNRTTGSMSLWKSGAVSAHHRLSTQIWI